MNKYILEEICKGMDMGIQAIDALECRITNEEMKQLVEAQKNHYLVSKNKAMQLMKSIPEETTMKKIESNISKAMVKMKAMLNDKDANIAKMMISGSNMFLMELNKLKNDNNPKGEVLDFIDDLLKKEQAHVDALKPFL